MLEWKSDTNLVFGSTEFELAPIDVVAAQPALSKGALLLRKPRWMVEQYLALKSEVDAKNIVELGIYEGGGTALLALLFGPRRLVAIDLAPTRTPALDAFVGGHDLSNTVRAHYGVNQADTARVLDIVTQEFGSEPLDLVVDDASHLLAESTASFNLLFPRLRPGGLFVLEDWSCQHDHDRALAETLLMDPVKREQLARALEARSDAPISEAPPSESPLSRLVLQLVLTAAYAEGVVAEITRLQRGWLVVRRGDAVLDANTFDIRDCYGHLGRTLLP